MTQIICVVIGALPYSNLGWVVLTITTQATAKKAVHGTPDQLTRSENPPILDLFFSFGWYCGHFRWHDKETIMLMSKMKGSWRPDRVHIHDIIRAGQRCRAVIPRLCETSGHLTFTLQGSGIKFTTLEASLRGIIYWALLSLGHQMVKAPGFYLLSLSKIEISQLNSGACDSGSFIYFYYLSSALPTSQQQ